MDIDKALAELRAAFPRVGWTATEDEPGSWTIKGGGLLIWNFAEGWMCHDRVAPTPLLGVRAWLASQPTAAFYPEPPSGGTVEVRGVLATQGESWSLAGWSGASHSDMREAAWDGMNTAPQDEKFPVLYYPVVIRVPVPVEPPVLVGEVSDV